MREPVQIDEIANFVRKEFPYLTWDVVERFHAMVVETKLNKTQTIKLYPHQYFKDYHNNGIYTVSYWFEDSKDISGHGSGIDTWEELQREISTDVQKCHIPTETQLSIFDL